MRENNLLRKVLEIFGKFKILDKKKSILNKKQRNLAALGLLLVKVYYFFIDDDTECVVH